VVVTRGRWESERALAGGQPRTRVRLYPGGELSAAGRPAGGAPPLAGGTWEAARPIDLRLIRIGRRLHLVSDFETPAQWTGEAGLRKSPRD
jgi:hypothetical protein